MFSWSDGAVTRLRYDSELRLTSVVGALGREWRYAYDAAGQLVGETDYNGRTLGYDYDAAGRLARRVNGAGETVAFDRNALGLVTSRRARSGGDEATTLFEHDLAGRLVRATSPDADLVLSRDRLGRIVSESVDGRRLTSSYDLGGRRLRRTTPAGMVTEWVYGPDGLPAEIRAEGHAIPLAYDVAGRLTRRGLPGRARLEQEYDSVGRLLEQRIDGRLGSVGRRYSYDAGRLVGVEDRLSGARRFELDLADRITRVDGPLDLIELYAYDPLGNITRAALPPADDRGRPGDAEHREYAGTLLARAGRTRCAYDRQGRLIRQVHTRHSRRPEAWTYAWDAEDHLVSVRTPDGTVWRYAYDALGRRVAKRRLDAFDSVAEEIRFTWDGATLVEESDAGGSRTWVHDGLAPLAQLSQDEVGTRFHAIVTDLVGSPTELLDESGSLAWHASRTLWGAPADSVPAGEEQVPLRFPGQYADPETGLHYNLHRYYDPRTGRYLSQDPLGLAPAPNPNAYVTNPTTQSDPLGLAPCRFELSPAGPGTYNSPAGLIYGPGSVHGHRLTRVLQHAVPDSSKAAHTVFSDGPGALRVIDEAWARRAAPEPGDPWKYVIPMGREVGIGGEQDVTIIVRPGTSQIITAYPSS